MTGAEADGPEGLTWGPGPQVGLGGVTGGWVGAARAGGGPRSLRLSSAST